MSSTNLESDSLSNPLPRSIGRPASSALNDRGIHIMEQVAELTEKELLAIHRVGPKAVSILKETLAKSGLSLRP